MGFKNYIKTVVIALPLSVTFFDCIGYVARVEGISMQPVLNPQSDTKDYVFLSRWAVRNMQIARGDIVSLTSPKDPEQKLIKRVVGLQGDVVSTVGYKKPFVRIPEGHIWVEGDHTGNSLDSNTFGPISLGLMTARANFVVWPPSRWQILESCTPSKRKPIIEKN